MYVTQKIFIINNQDQANDVDVHALATSTFHITGNKSGILFVQSIFLVQPSVHNFFLYN